MNAVKDEAESSEKALDSLLAAHEVHIPPGGKDALYGGRIGSPPHVADDALKLNHSPFPPDGVTPMTPVIIDAPSLTPPHLVSPDELIMEARKLSKLRLTVKKITLGLVGFALFYIALGLMKDGAHALTPLIRGWLSIGNMVDSMGFGWLMAYVIQSGSPVAAIAMSLLSAGAITAIQAYTMVAGSRLGASLIVLQIGAIYALRQRDKWSALTAGILSLLLTGSVMSLSLPLGLLVLRWGWLDGFTLPALTQFAAGAGGGLDRLVRSLASLLPSWVVFGIGVGLVIASFQLFDRALPEFKLEEGDLGLVHQLIYRPEVMFMLGFGITLLTMSVSISVGILVPLSTRGYMRRENIMPYILGANISTLVDTLAAAILLGNPQGITVMMAHMVCGAAVSLMIIVLAYHRYERLISRSLSWMTQRRRNFIVSVGVAFVCPLLFIFM